MPAASDHFAPLTRLPRNFGRGLIWLYRHSLSPLIGFHCRHMPTCSQYGDTALMRFGLWRGGWMTLARLLRCHPWGTSGIDNVPERLSDSARWYLPWRYGRWRGTHDGAVAERSASSPDPSAACGPDCGHRAKSRPEKDTPEKGGLEKGAPDEPAFIADAPPTAPGGSAASSTGR